MSVSEDQLYMMRCLQLAQLAEGNAAPNPLVGAVLVHQGRIIGEGFHQVYGAAHAEVNCFASVSEADRVLIPESTLYVSLEPCAHFGKTPPCADRVIRERVQRVVVANRDPFAAVDGKGLDKIQAAGIRVDTGILEQDAAWLNRRFFCVHTRNRPYIILKWAQTQNGFFAPADRSRLQISNSWSKRLNDRWRAKESAIMVGTVTAINDNPRLSSSYGRAPLRIALDKSLRIPATHQLLQEGAETWIINELEGYHSGSVRYHKLPFDDHLLIQLLGELKVAGKNSLIVEGGVQLLQSFVDQGLWDEARVFIAGDVDSQGIQAPRLSEALQCADWPLGENRLHYYIHNNNPYAPGALGLQFY
ncbi:MAG: bifunctional diaminohydroxyphosphoribosylaminopyrimidine deaminase/5-amino-6-(5-phosphoribosylamino)uracil reductase RibD [Chitinophagaceae bacterium]